MSLVLVALSAVCAIVPMVCFLLIIWWMDHFDREPIWLVGLTFLWGAIGAVFSALVGSSMLMMPMNWMLGATLADQLSAVVVAPLVEEPTKALILFLVMFSRHFDHAGDGFVYGAAAGLGFGMTENFLYFSNAAQSGDVFGWAFLVLIRTFFSALMHGTATSVVGAALGYARFRGWLPRLVAVPAGFLVAMGIHATWNGLATLADVASPAFQTINFLLFPVEFLFIFGVFQFTIWDQRRILRRELADEVQQQLLPLAHASAIGSVMGRRQRDWVPRGIPHKQYVKAATTLAMRKHQCRNTTGGRHAFYADEVMRLRQEVRALLKLAEHASG